MGEGFLTHIGICGKIAIRTFYLCQGLLTSRVYHTTWLSICQRYFDCTLFGLCALGDTLIMCGKIRDSLTIAPGTLYTDRTLAIAWSPVAFWDTFVFSILS